jgi:hypothetical protein
MLKLRFFVAALVFTAIGQRVIAQEVPKPDQTKFDPHAKAGHRGPECFVIDRFFAHEVWTKVGATTCLKCHKVGGDAADSKFLLKDIAADASRRTEVLYQNQLAFLRMAKTTAGDSKRLLVKAHGGLDHGGGTVHRAIEFSNDSYVG